MRVANEIVARINSGRTALHTVIVDCELVDFTVRLVQLILFLTVFDQATRFSCLGSSELAFLRSNHRVFCRVLRQHLDSYLIVRCSLRDLGFSL